MKKMTRKSRAVRPLKSLPAKALSRKQSKGVKGGDGPTETITFNYGKLESK